MHPNYLVRTIKLPGNKTATRGNRNRRSLGYYSKLWDAGSTVTVGFMHDVPDDLAYRIERIIRQWDPHHNLALEFVPLKTAKIRIALGGEHNESYLGTDALLADPAEFTLRLGVQPEDPMFESVLLHEFGHALGFDHMHLHPDADIPWNRAKVYAYYEDLEGWTEQQVNLFIFDFPNDPDVFLGVYDKHSIMHYEIPAFLTDGKWQTGQNLRISEQDKINMRQIYPAL